VLVAVSCLIGGIFSLVGCLSSAILVDGMDELLYLSHWRVQARPRSMYYDEEIGGDEAPRAFIAHQETQQRGEVQPRSSSVRRVPRQPL
jgi:hypothetical protein